MTSPAIEIIAAAPESAPYEAAPEPTPEPKRTTAVLTARRTEHGNVCIGLDSDQVLTYSDGRPFVLCDAMVNTELCDALGLAPTDYEVQRFRVTLEALPSRHFPRLAIANPVVI